MNESSEGLFGGSFDPIHLGHIRLAQAACDALGLQKLLIMPAAASPYKQTTTCAAPEQRLEMCRLALAEAGDERLVLSDLELRRDPPSYTWQTVKELEAPGRKLWLLVGADAFMTVQNWKYSIFIRQGALLAAGCRAGDERAQLEKQADFLSAIGFVLKLIDYEPLPVSSTEVRRRIAAGEPTDGLIAPSVRAYIDAQGLYR